MKATIEISDLLFEQAKRLSAKEGLSFQSLVEEGLRGVIERRRRLAAKPFRLRDGSFHGGGGLQPGIEMSDLRRLAYEDRWCGSGE